MYFHLTEKQWKILSELQDGNITFKGQEIKAVESLLIRGFVVPGKDAWTYGISTRGRLLYEALS